MRFFEPDDGDLELISAARAALSRAQSRAVGEDAQDGAYRGGYHTVGGAVRGASGRIYTGVNCDGIHGACAEYVAVGAAISEGEGELLTIVAVNDHAPNGICAPCGNCRQMLIEYCPNILVILNDENGRMVKIPARDLLPLAWMPSDA